MAYKKTTRVEQKLQQVKAAILSAGLMLVETGGWRACTVTRVAREAKVATGTIYTHFGNIAALQCAVYSTIGDEELAVLTDIARRDMPPAEKLDCAVRSLSMRSLKGRKRAYAVIAEPSNPEIETLRQTYHTAFIEQFRLIVEKGVTAGDMPSQPPEVTAACILGAITQALVTPLADDNTTDPAAADPLVEAVSSLCLRAAGAIPLPHQTKQYPKELKK